MPTDQTTKPTGEPVEFTLAASLRPADAGEVRDNLVAALGKAKESGAPLAIELDEGDALTCALQLVVAAEKSAEASGVPIQLGSRAADARARLSTPSATEQQAK
ncbi:MAG: hypothetical protein AAGC57_04275 [Pseudomonadota bacterium]